MHASGLFPSPLTEKEAQLKNPLALAFIGDSVWDVLVRGGLLRSGAKVNTLHKQAIAKVNAGAQAKAYQRMLPHLTSLETDVARRGENAHAKHNVPKNQDPVDYSRATGLEALWGYLYLTGQESRILELFDIGWEMP